MAAIRFDVISIGTLSRNRLWNEREQVRSPHATTTLKTDDATWQVVLAPPSRMMSRGLTREMLTAGETATVEGYPHRTNKGELRAERITIGGKTVELR